MNRKEADYLGSLWENGGGEDKRHGLEMLKDGCGEVREERFGDRPEFPVRIPARRLLALVA